MNDQLARSLFMDYLYDEISEEEKEQLEDYLREHPSMQEELQELQKTRTMLQQLPYEEPSERLLVVEPRERTFSQWLRQAGNLLPQSAWGKTAFAMAASLVLLVMVASVAQLHIQTGSAGMEISFGQTPQPSLEKSEISRESIPDETASDMASNLSDRGEEIAEPAAKSAAMPEQELKRERDMNQEILQQLREQNAALMEEYARLVQQQHQQQLLQVVRYFELQRQNDLQLIEQSLDRIQEANNYRWQRANQVLGEVIQNVNYEENN
ncbi:MAG: hypothetical protein R3211_05170 [Balneolaceae bacterium]|nr:hypothetical protein [Balneolaceae bacterium]